MSKNSGFTLIELLVALTILVVLIAGSIASFNFQGTNEKSINFGLQSILASSYSDIGSYVYTYNSAPSVAECTKETYCNGIFKAWPKHPAAGREIIYGRVAANIKEFCFAGLAEPKGAEKYIVTSNIESFPNLKMCKLTNGESGFKTDCLVNTCISYP
ncbi:MAG: prepilin-type N-terminal cleavage/methylation domain-containing protein [bacterium]|nr:prepilin-type N-terminal cleavage/methylation domain-containing protein [bacterium]